MNLSFGPSYTTSESSLQTSVTNNGGGFNANESFNIYLPAKFKIGSDGNFEYRAKTQSFNQDFKRFILNANLSKAFFKQENLKLVVSGNDLFNQNVGFNRSATSTLLTQSSYTTIKRYFMFSVVYDFNKMGGSPSK